ncbi:hypothetical protein I4U23_015136 [Adineta vaga]|nr:hypothetical protein I4U23_015136 [Adineta vaga]
MDYNSIIFREFTHESFQRIEHYRQEACEIISPNKELAEGQILPEVLQNKFPDELIGKPIEEIDWYYRIEYVFVVINRNKTIYRFNLKPACFLFSPLNCFRRLAIRILTHSLFSTLIMLTILTNCICMTFENVPDTIEIIFTIVYTSEALIKCLARGFVLGKFTFLRDSWNWLDFIVIILAYITFFINMGKFAVLRVFRVLRVLKTVAVVPGLKTIVNALIQSFISLRDVTILSIFILSIFALVGMQLYMGVLRQKCVPSFDSFLNSSTGLNQSYKSYLKDLDNETYWYQENQNYVLCGNASGTTKCPVGYVCWKDRGINPDFGYTSFDNYGWAMLACFRLMTQDYWENLYLLVLSAAGRYHFLYFVVVIFFGSFYLVNLILAIVSMSYLQQQTKTEEENKESERREIQKKQNDDQAFSTVHCHQLSLILSNTIVTEDIPNVNNTVITFDQDHRQYMTSIELLPVQLRSTNIARTYAQKFLRVYCCEWNCQWPMFDKFRTVVSLFILDAFVELFITICIILNTLFMALDQPGQSEKMTRILTIGNYIFTSIFTVESVFKIIALTPAKFYKNGWNVFDFLIVTVSLIELGLANVKGLSVLRSFRLLRVFKLAKSWQTLNRLISIIGKSIGALGNLTLILIIMIFIFAVMGMQLFGQKYAEKFGNDIPRWNFSDFFHAFMIVFRVLCGEWIESMWVCLECAGWPCIPFFLLVFVIGNLVILNLFLALLLASFNSNVLVEKEEDDNENKITEAIDRIRRFIHRLCHRQQSQRLMNDVPLPVIHKLEESNTIIHENIEMQPIHRRISSIEPILHKPPDDCCPKFISKHFICCTKCIPKALEDVYSRQKPTFTKVLILFDIIFTIIFTIELILKWLAYGIKTYFTNGWNNLDFIIVVVSVFGTLLDTFHVADIPVLKSMRTLRALRPLKALSRFEGIRVVVNALFGAIPAIFNVLLVCLVFWLIFSIMGVQLFGGKFYKCVYVNTHDRVNISENVTNKIDCLIKNFTWENSRINFDNVLSGYLALFQVATFKGWVEIMADATDAKEIGVQPTYESNVYVLVYFVIFIIFGSFFTLNLFIGVVIDSFNQQKRLLGVDGTLQMFMTEDQKKYYNAMKKMGNKKPTKAIPRPKFFIGRFLFDLTRNQAFDIFIMICILLNMICMCLEHYNQSHTYDFVLALINHIFVGIFTIECLMKLIALNFKYFMMPWNIFDFIIVIASILGQTLGEIIAKFVVNPTLLRVVRIVRIGRILRLIKGTKGIRTLLFALAVSLPALFNIGLLLFLVMFIYSIFGMSFFAYVKKSAGITDLFNFETFPNSMIVLFQMCTTAGWSGVYQALTNDRPPDCDPTLDLPSNKGNCGDSIIATTFLVSYVIITSLVVVNMYIAVILENFFQVQEEVQQGLTDDDYDMYYEKWQQLDPSGSQFIRYDQLSDFVDSLEPPLRIPKPNKLSLAAMNLPICVDDRMYYVDILDGLTKYFLGTFDIPVESLLTDTPINIIKDRPTDYHPITTTVQRQRELYLSRIGLQGFRANVERCRNARNKQSTT